MGKCKALACADDMLRLRSCVADYMFIGACVAMCSATLRRHHSYDEERTHQAASTPRADLLENASTRIWCGNIASHVTSRTLKTIFASHGYYLTDVAVFPARIGPLGYAFINFPTLDQAVDAFTKLQNTVIPAITASKQLKMRFKPIQVPRVHSKRL